MDAGAADPKCLQRPKLIKYFWAISCVSSLKLTDASYPHDIKHDIKR
jgi:hypothetical protein